MCRTLILSVVLLFPQGLLAATALPPAEQWLPQDALAIVQVNDSQAILDLALHPKVVGAVGASEAYKKATADPGFGQFRNLIVFLENQLDTDWQDGLRKLTAGGVTWAIGPGDTSLLIVDAEDPTMLRKIHETFRFIAQADAKKKDEGEQVSSAEYRGVTGWSFGPNEAHAIIGRRLLITNKPEALKAALDLRADPSGDSIAKLPAYRAAREAAGTGADAVVYVDLEKLNQLPQLRKALTARDNPMATLLLAPLGEAVAESTWLGLGLSADEGTLLIEGATDASSAAEELAFARPADPADGAPAALSVPRQIAEVALWRDLRAFYSGKDDLFPERTSELIFFENMMGIFFTGRDLTQEVFAETTPSLRLVVAEQEYDPEFGAPQVQLPAFAAVFQLQDPKKFRPVAEEAWQKGLGLINFTRGQQALPGLIIDRVEHGGIKYTLSRFADVPEDDDPVPLRFNFRPTLAMPGDHLILSSTDGLAEDLIDALNATADAEPRAGVHSAIAIDGKRLASILRANQENLIRQNMVEEGNSREQAETAIGLLLTVIDRFGPARLDVGTRDDKLRATLRVKLDLD
jgi:hypothetical protein